MSKSTHLVVWTSGVRGDAGCGNHRTDSSVSSGPGGNHRPRSALPSAAQCSTDRPAGMRQTFALPVTRANAANSDSTATASTETCSVSSMIGPGSSSSIPHSAVAYVRVDDSGLGYLRRCRCFHQTTANCPNQPGPSSLPRMGRNHSRIPPFRALTTAAQVVSSPLLTIASSFAAPDPSSTRATPSARRPANS